MEEKPKPRGISFSGPQQWNCCNDLFMYNRELLMTAGEKSFVALKPAWSQLSQVTLGGLLSWCLILFLL